jgi:hypothetical protein
MSRCAVSFKPIPQSPSVTGCDAPRRIPRIRVCIPFRGFAEARQNFCMCTENEATTMVLRSSAMSRIVSVYRVRIGNAYAACSCGWSGRRRILRAMACQDAWMHSVDGGCDVNYPLVIPVRFS